MKYILTTFLLLFSIYVSAQCGTVDVQQIGTLSSPSASNVSLSVSYIKNAVNIAPSSDNDISVLWSTGETTDQIDNLGSGLYSVTVTDAVEDCSVVEKVTVSYVASPETNGGEVTAANISATNQVCAEANSGSVDISITSGVAPYDIYLTHQQSGYGVTGYLTNNSTFTFIGLAPGDYDITVVNANGYATEFTAIVLADNLSSVIETLSEPLCYGGTGSVKAVVYDGVEEVVDVSDYSFLWSNGATTQTLTDVPAGVYTVTVTKNSTSCDYESPTYTLRQPNQLNLSVTSIQEASTYQSNDGNIVMTTTGGTTADGFYDYTWSDGFINNGVISSTNNNLTPGTYEITVTDDNGCTDEELVILGPNPPSNLLGNAGILHTSGDPDKIYLVGVQEDLRTESMLAIDTITSNVYIYKANDPVGSKWDLLSANGIFDNQDDEIQSILLDTLTYTDSIGIALTLNEQYKYFPSSGGVSSGETSELYVTPTPSTFNPSIGITGQDSVELNGIGGVTILNDPANKRIRFALDGNQTDPIARDSITVHRIDIDANAAEIDRIDAKPDDTGTDDQTAAEVTSTRSTVQADINDLFALIADLQAQVDACGCSNTSNNNWVAPDGQNWVAPDGQTWVAPN